MPKPKRYSRPPAHHNEFAFRHNPKSKLTQKIMSLPSSEHACPSCLSILEWRKKYRKYKILKRPRKCVQCQQKTVRASYHARCDVCAAKEAVCAKCGDARAWDDRKHPELCPLPPPDDYNPGKPEENGGDDSGVSSPSDISELSSGSEKETATASTNQN
jgi:hypothetical protein